MTDSDCVAYFAGYGHYRRCGAHCNEADRYPLLEWNHGKSMVYVP